MQRAGDGPRPSDYLTRLCAARQAGNDLRLLDQLIALNPDAEQARQFWHAERLRLTAVWTAAVDRGPLDPVH